MTRVVVILAHASDVGSRFVADWLASKLGAQAVRIVRPETLSLAQWSQTVDGRGRAITRVAWPREEPLEDSGVGAVFNRIRYLPTPRFHRASAKDRDYAGAELQAVVTSWLAGFDERVVHVVRRHPWLTPMLPLQHWASAAAACQLPVAARTIISSARALRRPVGSASTNGRGTPAPPIPGGSVLVAGREAAGSLSSRYGSRCLALARALGFPLLEFRFASDRDAAVLVDVDPLPPLLEPWAVALTGHLLESLAAGVSA